jgi:hypothetical protein
VNDPKAGAKQTPCPNCGGYRVNADVLETLPVLLRAASREVFEDVGVPRSISGSEKVLLGGLYLCYIVPGVVYHRYLRRRRTRRSDQLSTMGLSEAHLRKINFSCLLCGYRWGWTGIGSPPTESVSPNKALIELGAQRLAAEEAQRRREQEAAAAAFFLLEHERRSKH